MEKILENYLKRGFGTMTKNDFEVAIFHYLLQDNQYADLSNYEMSRKLRIPESKVVRLRYEESLKYQGTDTDEDVKYLRKLSECLQKVRLYKGKDTITLSIEDKATRLFLKSLLKQDNRIIDGSFNSELVVLQCEDYVYLLTQIDEKVGQSKLKEYGKEKIVEITKDLIGSISSEGVANLVDLGCERIFKLLRN